VLGRSLRRRGHVRFAAWEYDSRGSVDRLAASLGRWVDAHLDGADLHVVGHSLGGIISRLWLQEHGGRARAATFVTLSTPHRGLARLPGTRLLPVVRELAPASPLLSRLEAGAAALDGLPCLSVGSTRDPFLRPWSNATFGGARLVPVQHAGHVGVLFSGEVHDLVADHLTRR